MFCSRGAVLDTVAHRVVARTSLATQITGRICMSVAAVGNILPIGRRVGGNVHCDRVGRMLCDGVATDDFGIVGDRSGGGNDGRIS